MQKHISRRYITAFVISGVVVASCTGAIDDLSAGAAVGSVSGPPGGTAPAGSDPVDRAGLPGPGLAAISQPRRLTADEYNRTLLQLLGDSANAGQNLPEDPRSPFDNDYTRQTVDPGLVTSAQFAAGEVAARFLSDTARRDRFVGCKPAAATDASCLRQFITRFGRLAWRRTLAREDVDGLMKLQDLANQDNDFYSAVDVVIRTVLQDPEFLFRAEAGAPVPGAPGLFKLSGPEVAARLAFFLWGQGPDDGLLTQAESGGLDTPDKVRSAATGMLTRSAARSRIARFHALWMGYERLPGSALALAMKNETDHLLSRVIFERQDPWQELLRSQDSYVTYDLAQHYGMTQLPPALKKGSNAGAWASYKGTKRQGLLSHATFLQLGVKNGDTHPVLRGRGVRELLLCQPPLLKPADMKIEPAMMTSSPCKHDELAAHAASACASCHRVMDPVGFGLEGYDAQGAYRASEYRKKNTDPKLLSLPAQAGESGAKECPIDGEGEIDGQKFNGPAGLAQLMLASPSLNACVVKRVYQFAMGLGEGNDPSTNKPKLDDVDQQFLEVMAKRMGNTDFRFEDLLLDFVSSGAFAHRRAGK